MAEFTLKVTTREKSGSRATERSRKQGLIPAVMYGHGLEAETFCVQYMDFSKMYDKAGESSIISLAPEKGTAANVIVHDVQLDPLTSRFSHVDFFQVRMDEALETYVPLEFIGEAPAVREMGGILVKPLEEVLISCLPKDLPHSIPVDLSSLKTFEDHLQVRTKLPGGNARGLWLSYSSSRRAPKPR
jgi:large subunit ribosomal protein L25